MTDYGTLIDEKTVVFERLLPGPLERVWSYLTVSEKRAKWLAEGTMDLRVGGAVNLVFKNGNFSPNQEPAPPDYREQDEGGMEHNCTITALDPPHMLTMNWGDEEVTSEVIFQLAEKGSEVLFTITHRKLVSAGQRINVSGGWHAHLDVLSDVLNERVPGPFWSNWQKLKDHYSAA